jgi:hypothetical protein
VGEREAHLLMHHVKRRWLADVRKNGNLMRRDASTHRSTVATCVRVEFEATQPIPGLSHPALSNKARCISYMRQEDNIYNNRVYRDKCHNNQSIYYIAEDLLQNKETPPRSNHTPRLVAPPEPPALLLWGGVRQQG